jgi:signal transduction histidine kinase
MIEEIMLHRQLRSAEDGDLEVKPEEIETISFLKSAISKIRFHKIAAGKEIIIDKQSSGLIFDSDRTLLERVIINLIKNALEATDAGGCVNCGCYSTGASVCFRVRNATVMPENVQMQVFQRSFSTKGKGRGIGTYSIKLLTENYLGGKASFISNEKDGTVFQIELPLLTVV